MGLTASVIRLLIEKGLSAEDIADVADAFERDSHAMSRVTSCDIDEDVTPEDLDEKRRKAADRKRRQRERERGMSRDVTYVTRDKCDNSPPLSLPPSFPPYPPNNPPPTHPHVGKPARVRGSKRDEVFVLPADIPQAEWDAFVEMRRMTKHPMTDHAKRLAINDLRTILAKHGHPFADVLNQSTLNNWRGLFALKEERNGRTNSYRDGRSAWLNADGTGLGGVGDERQLFD